MHKRASQKPTSAVAAMKGTKCVLPEGCKKTQFGRSVTCNSPREVCHVVGLNVRDMTNSSSHLDGVKSFSLDPQKDPSKIASITFHSGPGLL